MCCFMIAQGPETLCTKVSRPPCPTHTYPPCRTSPSAGNSSGVFINLSYDSHLLGASGGLPDSRACMPWSPCIRVSSRPGFHACRQNHRYHCLPGAEQDRRMGSAARLAAAAIISALSHGTTRDVAASGMIAAVHGAGCASGLSERVIGDGSALAPAVPTPRPLRLVSGDTAYWFPAATIFASCCRGMGGYASASHPR